MEGSFQLSEIKDGGLQEMVNIEMRKIMDNIGDINMNETGARKLTITGTFKPVKGTEGEIIHTSWNVKGALQGPKEQHGTLYAYHVQGETGLELRSSTQEPKLDFEKFEKLRNKGAENA